MDLSLRFILLSLFLLSIALYILFLISDNDVYLFHLQPKNTIAARLDLKINENCDYDNETKVNQTNLRPIWAYFDPRFNRISIVLSYNITNTVTYCHYFDKNKKLLTPSYITETDPKYFVHCQEARYAPYVFLSLQEKLECDFNVSQLIEVKKIPEESAKWNLSICLAPIFGDYHHWMLLLQFVEAYRLLGAEKFFIYFLETKDNATLTILDNYVKKNIAEVIEMPKIGFCANDHRCRHNFQIQDCIFRSINRYKYAAVVDIDEIITPLQHRTLAELIRSVDIPKNRKRNEKKKKFGAFRFRPRWLPRDLPDPPGRVLYEKNITNLMSIIDVHLPVIRFHDTTRAPSINHTTKCIVKPETVLNMGVHYVREFMKNYTTYRMELDEGIVRHYRNKSTWAGKERKIVEKTNMPFDLEKRIFKAVKKTVVEIKNM